MARVTIQLPSTLGVMVGGQRSLEVDAPTLAEALRCLTDALPLLAGLLLDESGRLRPQVLCFHNETNTRWLEDLHIDLAKGDTITILQAVSGG